MREHDGMEKLDDLELDKVVGGVNVIDGWGQQTTTKDLPIEEITQTDSLENRIRRPEKKKRSDWLL